MDLWAVIAIAVLIGALAGAAAARRNRPEPHATVHHPAAPQPAKTPPVQCIGITLDEMRTFERVLLHADESKRRARPYESNGTYITELIGRLYESAGAASVLQPDPDTVRIPLQKHDFHWLRYAIRDIDIHRGSADTADEGRLLLNRFHALLGQARAVVFLGGTPAFHPDAKSAGPGTLQLSTAPYSEESQ
ncbi:MULTISPECIES: hypothetical protein [unclassified Streptomyces]|uniref:hypothetical protein n=1 Tax=unclassified Streptomyces TaxID=2593676 RepID=UPI001BE9709A|nr:MULTISPECIES: hypothetical protein [unclassified Streptomyces]MBT2406889.1 hypothetical protein [Streptomyces sp. ISL-21]MBT2613076.1 hypothetical protein [Streptomyces sp. ISL-87]